MTSIKPSTISKTTSKAAVAIIAATIGLATIIPAANAAGPDRDGSRRGEMHANRQDGPRGGQNMNHGMMDGRGGQFLAIGCGPNAAERIETSLVRLAYRVDATAEQKTLLDALKTTALDAQADLAATCAEIRPARLPPPRKHRQPMPPLRLPVPTC